MSNWHMSDAPEWTEGYQGRLEPNFEAKVMTFDAEDGSVAQEVQPAQVGEL